MKKINLLFLFSSFLLQSCLLKPNKPGKETIQQTSILNSSRVEVINLTNQKKIKTGKKTDVFKIKKFNVKKNALFVAVDDTVWQTYSEQIEKLYKKPVRLEEISWWMMAPKMNLLYDQVVKINYNNLDKKTFKAAIKKLEKLGLKYDLYILTHGIPNNITASLGKGFINYEDIEKLGKFVNNLEMVYMQGCFSSTLMQDWKKLGAKHVFGFDGWNRNFFFINFFIDSYTKYPNDIEKAYYETDDNIEKNLRKSLRFKYILKSMNLDIGEYLNENPSPIML